MQRNSRRFAETEAKLFHARVRHWMRGAIGLVILVIIIAVVQSPTQSTPTQVKSNPSQEENRLPDKPGKFQSHDEPAKPERSETTNATREKQIEIDTARLLELATQLKAEVDKTNKDTLSINVIRKAESIEKLAKVVKEKMKTIGPT